MNSIFLFLYIIFIKLLSMEINNKTIKQYKELFCFGGIMDKLDI